jgi:Uma2 family endonuclease
MGYDLNGLGMATPSLEHKQISRNILINFYLQYGFTQYEIYQEAAANERDPDSLVPDLMICKKGSRKPLIVVELERTKRLKRATSKLEAYFEEYGVQEVFICDYQTGLWLKYTTDYEQLTDESDIIKGLQFAPMTELPDKPPVKSSRDI